MTQLEKLEQELLSKMECEPEMFAETEDICVIDPKTRTIAIPASRRLIGVESDESVERLYFRCPKIVGDNIDLSTLSLRINYQNAGRDKDQYVVTDMKVDGGNITFSWQIRRKVAKYKGNISFIVCAVKASGGVIKNEWNTTLNTDCEVLEGLEVDQTGIQEETKDVVEQLLEIMNTSAEEAVQKVTAEGEKQIEAVQEASQEVAADREQIGKNKADIAELFRIKAPAIICEAQGKNITVEDSSENYFNGLNIYGKSEQVQTTGKNLFSVEMDKTQGVGNTYLYTLKLKPNMKYTLSCDVEKDIAASLYFMNSSTTEGGVFKNAPRTTTTGEDGTVKIYVRYAKEEYGINLYQALLEGKHYAQLEEGETVTYPEPFTGGKPSPSPEYPQEIEGIGNSENSYELEVKTTGKNLFNIKDNNKLNGSSKHEIVGESLKIIALDGNTSPVVFCELEHPEKYIGKTIYLKCDEIIKSNANTKPCIVLKYTKNNNLTIKNILNLDTSGKEVSIKLPNDLGLANKVSLAFYVSFNGTYNNGDYAIFNKVMLSREPIEDYQAYKESTSYIPIDSPLYDGDYIYLENGELWECRENARVVFDGSEDEPWIEYFDRPTSIKSFMMQYFPNCRLGLKTSFCDKFINKQNAWLFKEYTIYSDHNEYPYKYFRQPNSEVQTLDEWKQWLQQNPIEIVYKLATPTRKRLDIESEEAIKTLKTYYPITHISNSGGAEMVVEYIVDTRLYIDGKFKELQETIVNAQTQMLKGV